MYVVSIPNRNSPPAVLLSESYREEGKVKNRTLANLSEWPSDRLEALRQVLRGRTPVGVPLEEAFQIIRSLPHGHVGAVVGTLRKLEVDAMLASKRCRERDLVVAMIVSRILSPSSKLAMSRALDEETKETTLGEVLGVEGADEDELYEAMDWLLARQGRIEKRLAGRHLGEGTLALYDLTSTYFEGRKCPLAQPGHSRDGKKGTLQIVFGLVADKEGRPVTVEVFDGNTADPKTVATQVMKLRDRFGLRRVVMVGDRGMLTSARIREDLKRASGIDWLTTLRAPAIRKLVARGSLQLSLFDEKDLADITDPHYPGERLVVCRNPLLAEERCPRAGGQPRGRPVASVSCSRSCVSPLLLDSLVSPWGFCERATEWRCAGSGVDSLSGCWLPGLPSDSVCRGGRTRRRSSGGGGGAPRGARCSANGPRRWRWSLDSTEGGSASPSTSSTTSACSRARPIGSDPRLATRSQNESRSNSACSPAPSSILRSAGARSSPTQRASAAVRRSPSTASVRAQALSASFTLPSAARNATCSRNSR